MISCGIAPCERILHEILLGLSTRSATPLSIVVSRLGHQGTHQEISFITIGDHFSTGQSDSAATLGLFRVTRLVDFTLAAPAR